MAASGRASADETSAAGLAGVATLRPKKPPPNTLTWDLNIDGGVGAAFESDTHLTGFGRIRGGLLLIDESDIASPSFSALGLTYEASDLSPAAFGIQVERMSLSTGLWGQLGAMLDIQPRPGFMAAVGWSLFGAEAQVRWDKAPGEGAFFAIYGKLRIPVSIIAYAMRQ